MILPEEILANRLHELGLGIYDENGTDGNIFLDNIPNKSLTDGEILISIYKSGSMSRNIALLGGSINPIYNIYIKSKKLLEASREAHKIANRISEDSYKKNDYIVHQTFIFSEPVRLVIDEKGDYTFSFQVIQNIEFL